jgi:hypothetical protein
MGHKQTFLPILPECLLPGVKQPLLRSGINEDVGSILECLLSPIAVIKSTPDLGL